MTPREIFEAMWMAFVIGFTLAGIVGLLIVIGG